MFAAAHRPHLRALLHVVNGVAGRRPRALQPLARLLRVLAHSLDTGACGVEEQETG